MNVVAINTHKGRFRIRAPYAYKDICKAIPGARWAKEARVWTYPATPHVALEINLALARTDLARVTADSAYGEMLEQGYAVRQAARYKTDPAETLPEIPFTATVPWEHQLRAYNYAYPQQAVGLWLDMGVGKSKVAVDLVVNRGHQLTLVLCPKSVLGVWPREFALHAGKPVEVYPSGQDIERFLRMTSEKKGKAVQMQLARAKAHGHQLVIVCNYDSAFREALDGVFSQAGFDCVIYDEMHKLKSPRGSTSMFAARLSMMVPYKIGLTGTPIPHTFMDVYAIYRALDPGIFGTSYSQFRARYAVMGGYMHKQVIDIQNDQEFNERLYSNAYRVKAEDVLDLPEAVHSYKECELDHKTRKLYNGLRENLAAEYKGNIITAEHALTKLIKLREITSGFLYTDEGETLQLGSAKEELLAEVLEGIGKDEPVVVFTQFNPDITAVKRVCERLGRTCGEVSGRKKDLTEEAKMPDDLDTLAVHVKAGGLGVDLTRARYAIYYSMGYSLVDWEQSVRRVHRPGQTRTTYYIHLIARTSIDEDIYAAVQAKKNIAEYLLQQLSEVAT